MPLTIGIRNLSSTDKKSRVDSSFQLIYHDPSDFGSLIPTRIISKERSPTLSWITDPRLRCLGSAMTLNEIQGLFPGGGGGLPYESGGDARCLAQGCKFQILDSLRQGCSGQNTIFSPKGLFQGCTRRNYIFSIRFIYSIHVIKV